ncbi:MAG: tryptophanase [Firmicutes bacterium]|nr:tryptophanase [Bacillota bacterium]
MKGEPFRIKMVEPIRRIPAEERARRLDEAGLNVFLLRSEDVYVDLLTDSGTGAMSDRQWAALMTGDEAYAGSRSFHTLREAVESITGYPYVLPTHQGRGAERVVFPEIIARPGQYVLGNIHFDTTRAHIELAGGRAVDLPTPEAADTSSPFPFKGNMDVEALRAFIDEHGAGSVAAIVLTVTCNSAGGLPVSLENARAVAAVAREHGILLLLDAARYAENAYLVREWDPGQSGRSPREIARDFFDLADGCLMSAKKDGLVNIGGFVAVRDEELYLRLAPRVVAFEGFLTYGGMNGRDMAALAVGLQEALEVEYLEQRIRQVRRLGERLRAEGVPIQYPVGGHAVFVDAGRMLPHIPPEEFPGAALAAELYLEGGVRAVEVGTLMMGRDPETGVERRAPVEFLRLAVPRRTYTDNHLDDVAEALVNVQRRAPRVRGLRLTYEPKVLRHFLARFEWAAER